MSDLELHSLREAELEVVAPLLPEHSRILEIGAGLGYQALLLSRLGHLVAAIDVRSDAPARATVYPVVIYDGVRLPAKAASVDCVFSSNVLEHVADFQSMQEEVRRVLRPGGVALHIVPSATWRIWTSMAHYIHYAKQILQSTRSRALRQQATSYSLPQQGSRLLRVLVAERHGIHGSALGEVVSFSRRSWARRFRDSGFDVITELGTGIFYTGYAVFGTLMSIRLRGKLARLLGSSCHVFLLRAADSGIAVPASGDLINGVAPLPQPSENCDHEC